MKKPSSEVSHENALEKVHSEYDKFNERMKSELSEVEKDYISNLEMKANQLKKGK